MAAGILAMRPRSRVHETNNHLATLTFLTVQGSLGYAVMSPAWNNFVGGYGISTGRDKTGSSTFASSPVPLKASILVNTAAAQNSTDFALGLTAYAPSINTGGAVHLSGSTPPDGGPPRRSPRLAGLEGVPLVCLPVIVCMP